MSVEDRIYEVVDPKEPPRYPPGTKLSRSKTIGPMNPSRYNSGINGYAVPRSILSTTPPIPRTQPPSIPPRTRNYSEGEGALVGSPNDRVFRGASSGSPSDKGFYPPPRSGILGTSPTDRSASFPRRPSIPSTGSISKSPSILSVSSNTTLEELSLSEFISKYSKSLPLRVKVCKGFYGVSDQTAVTTGDIFNLHFLKNTKIVVVETKEGTRLSIPLNSSIMVSLLYDPNDNLEEAVRGFRFETVGEICAMKVLPKVIRATRSYQGSSAENSVSEHELLVVKSTKSKLTGKQLRVYSITAGKKKCLSDNCAGCFSTAPADIKLHFYEITMHVQEVFPYKAILSLPESTYDSALNDLHCTTVTLKKAMNETSVIATSGLDDDDMGEQSDTAELPVDLDIEVEAVALDENELEQLRQDTSYMYENFDSSSVCLYMTKSTKRLYDIQCLLYQTLMVGSYRGLEILRPSALSQQLTKGKDAREKTYQPLNKDELDSSCTDYYVVMTPRSISVDHSTGDSSDQSADSHIGDGDHLSLLEVHNKHIEKRMGDISEDVQKLTKDVVHLKRFCESLQTQLRMVQAEAMTTEARVPAAPSPSSSCGVYTVAGDTGGQSSSSDTGPELSSEQYLLTLNHKQVLMLLEAMGLKQYQENFKQEQVNGEILSECDEEVLKNDLGIKSKLHRMRLMKVVTGRHSAKRILAGEDPYAHKEKQLSEATSTAAQ